VPNPDSRTGPRIVVIGASAGGVEALTTVVGQLPEDIDAAIFIVIHVPHNAKSVLPRILQRAGELPAMHVLDEAAIDSGVIYVAPPDRHLLIKPGRVTATFGPRENGHRPAVDPLFRSAAEAYGPSVIGVILSGNLDDGTSGLAAIKRQGGVAIVQDPEEAVHNGMPLSAVNNVQVDFVLPLTDIGRKIVHLLERVPRVAAQEETVNGDIEKEVRSAELEPILIGEEPSGEPSGFTCPECNGGLWEVVEGKLVRYRCRVGHAYTADSLLSASGSQVEAALWFALRSLEENAAFAERLSKRADSKHQQLAARRFAAQAKRASHHAVTLRKILLSTPAPEEGEILQVGMAKEEV
jgi:two-component system chemotaxis response regulator CheB